MAHESLSLSELIPATEGEIYAAWLNSETHAAFTGDTASIEPVIGGKHSTLGGYAQGSIVELQPDRRIVQTWRTTDFPEGSPDSRLELTLEATVGGTMLTILHTDIPEGQSDDYREGWAKYYFDPLKRFFGEERDAAPGAPDDDTDVDLPAPAPAASPKKPAAKVTARAKTPAKTAAKAPVKAKPATKTKQATKPKAKLAARGAAKNTKSKAKAKAKPKAKARAKTAPKRSKSAPPVKKKR